jgi:hypothetical protein
LVESGNDCPEVLIDKLALARKRGVQDAFMSGADSFEGGIAPRVVYTRAGFDPVHAEHVKYEIEQQMRRVAEQSGPPQDGIEEETQFRSKKVRLCAPQLKETGGVRHPSRNDSEADVSTVGSLGPCPFDEPSECLDGGRWRPGVCSNVRGTRQTVQRWRIRPLELAQYDPIVAETW